MNTPIHVAITRRVRPGCEAQFQEALREFLQTSFNHGGVLGASMVTPPPDSESREYGVLRTFANEKERDVFYESPTFKEWETRVLPLVEGERGFRQLHGLEAWFRNSGQPVPPQWKMALLTWLAVWPVSMAVPALLNPILGSKVSNFIFAGAVAAGIVLVLTWAAMPALVHVAQPWLEQNKKYENDIAR